MFRSFLLAYMAFFNLAIAYEDLNHALPDQRSFASEILTQQPDSILLCTDIKLYLRPEKIHPTHQGLLIGDKEPFIPIPFLFADEMGYYLPLGTKPSSDYTGYWTCWNPECKNYGKIWKGRSQYCPKCGKPAQPS